MGSWRGGLRRGSFPVLFYVLSGNWKLEMEMELMDGWMDANDGNSDKKNDERALDRKLVRTLYLVVKSATTGTWSFPSGDLIGRESLEQAAERVLVQTAGVNMNTWIVGHAPVGVYKSTSEVEEGSSEKTFFMKGRIMAGQADLEGNLMGAEDWKWLTREELQRLWGRSDGGRRYLSQVRGMLADR